MLFSRRILTPFLKIYNAINLIDIANSCYIAYCFRIITTNSRDKFNIARLIVTVLISYRVGLKGCRVSIAGEVVNYNSGS